MHSKSIGALARRAAPAALALALAAAPALAFQDAAASGKEYGLGTYIYLSGFVGWCIVALSVVALGMVIENFITLKRDKLAPPEVVEEVSQLFDEGKFQEALELCEAQENFFGRVCAAGIGKIGHPYDVIRSSLQEMGDEETLKLQQKLNWLTVIGAIAPMMGLFGTVQGMIVSFKVIAETQNPTPADLATGIYIALLTTFEGLVVAMPTIVAYAYLRNRLMRSLIEIGAMVEDLFERFRTKV